MLNQPIFSAFSYFSDVLRWKEKVKCFYLVCFSLAISLAEVVTASTVLLFTKVIVDQRALSDRIPFSSFLNEMPQSELILFLAILLWIIFIIKNLAAGLEVFFLNFSVQKMLYRLKNDLLNRYSKGSYNLILTRNSSYPALVINSDAEYAFNNGLLSMGMLISESVVFILLVVFLIYLNPFFAILVFFLGSLVCFVVIKILLPKYYIWGSELQKMNLIGTQSLYQFFHAFKEVILLNKVKSFINEYNSTSKRKGITTALQVSTSSMPRLAIETLFVSIFVFGVIFLTWEYDDQTVFLGVMGGYLYAGFRLMPGMNRIINNLNSIKMSLPYLKRVHEEYHNVAIGENFLNVPSLKFEKNIMLKNVSFRYFNSDKTALSNINLEIKNGERVGIIGETGSGKSTLLDLILGFQKCAEGQILLDNQYPVNSFQWHKMIGYVQQSIYLTDQSIRQNITFSNDEINNKRLKAAIENSQLKDFINSLKHGAETMVGERGVRLSGGERQRIAIARALYNDPKVLIFDEATSALDVETEKKILRTIDGLAQNRTIIMITHKLSTLKGCDRVLRIHKGKIIESKV